MTRRLCALALALYPLAFRRRYGDELAALVEDRGAGPAVALDLLRGAIAAHVRPLAGLEAYASPRERVTGCLRAVVVCWLTVVAVGLGYAKTTEDAVFSAAGHAHPLLADAHLAVEVLAWVAVIGVAAGQLLLARRRLRPAALCGTLVAACLGAIGVATAVYAVSLGADAAPVAALPNGPAGMFGSSELSVSVQAALMVAAAVPAAIAARRATRHAR